MVHPVEITSAAGVRGIAGRAPIAVFLVGTFIWAWLLWGFWIPAMPSGGLVITPAFMVCALVGGFAPSLSAVATAWLTGGKAAVGELLRPLRQWSAPALVWLLALFTVPGLTLVSTLLQPILVGPVRGPDPLILAVALVWPLLAALGEEIGWRGFMFPRLLPRFGYIPSAIVLGLLWGLWHLPADYVGLKGYGDLFVFAFLLNGPAVLTAHALIMAWLWKRSTGNLPMMVIYHLTITASAMVAPVAGGQDPAGLAAAGIGVTLLWAVAISLWTLFRPASP